MTAIAIVRVCAALLLAACSGTAMAHGLRVAVEATADAVSGAVTYDDGDPAPGEWVALFVQEAPSTAAALHGVAADAEGRFRFPAMPSTRYRIVVTANEDHVIQQEIATPAASP